MILDEISLKKLIISISLTGCQGPYSNHDHAVTNTITVLFPITI